MRLKFEEYDDRYYILHLCEIMSFLIRALQCMLMLFMMITLFEIEKRLHKDSNSSASH